MLALPRFTPKREYTPDGDRQYVTPHGLFAGVTSILSGSCDDSDIQEWRESIGEERADFIRDLAAYRGTQLHDSIELYLKTGNTPSFSFLHTPYWKSIKLFLPNILHPVLLEGAVWHPCGYAGTLDALAYLGEFVLPNGDIFLADTDQPTLCDWKSADSLRSPRKLYEYSLQVSAYVSAANYVYVDTGLDIQRALIAVAIADSPPQYLVLDKNALTQLSKHFLARLQRYTFARS